MDELVKLVSERTGISEEVAKVAVETVLSFVKERLPDPIAGQLDGLLDGDVDVGDLLGNLGGLGGLGGLLGGR